MRFVTSGDTSAVLIDHVFEMLFCLASGRADHDYLYVKEHINFNELAFVV